MTKHHAECQCGRLQVSTDADPDFTLACNCKACQKGTGAPFGAGLYFRKDALDISGRSETCGRVADSGRKVENHFCPDCGTTLFWSLEMRPDHMGVAYGCFETPVPDPIRAIWTQEKHGWVKFPDDWPTYPAGSPS
ncbi:MAG: GFA family protein [Silicimonas sp.]|nr:GFA family protein [Silicimonas sp.]